MRFLSERLREITGGHGFSVLYSDVGPEFYAKNGRWKAYDADEVVVPSSKLFEDKLSVGMLNIKEAEDFIDEDVRILRKEFVGDNDSTIIQMIPQDAELEWTLVRDRQATRNLKLEEVEFVGAKVSSMEGWGYILWFHEYKESSLTVLRLREPPTDAGLRGLLDATVSEAR
jgi:hypothetical protein